MKIIFVDDHQMFREGVKSFILGKYPEWQIDTCSTITTAWEQIEKGSYGMLLCDLNFPLEDISGKDLLLWVKEKEIKLPSVVLSMDTEFSTFIETVKLGARGYVSKGVSSKQLLQAIETVADGGIFFDQQILQKLVGYIESDLLKSVKSHKALIKNLSDRESSVFQLLVQNQNISEIAQALGISNKTVENHRTAIYKKLNVTDRLGLYDVANQSGVK